MSGGQLQQGGGLGGRQDCPILQTLYEEAHGGTEEPLCSPFCSLLVLLEFDAGKSKGGVGSGDRGQAGREGKIPV